ncbi:MAG: hypothetical protein ACI9W6_003164 [Motiliproteus sp.]|jgi:hypothetical protein
MLKRFYIISSLAICASTSAFAGGDCGAVNSGNANLNELNPYYYNGNHAEGTTDSGIPHLPAYYGHMQTNNTYRFFNVNEMVATMIGEGKHGMWRYQDNGTVREYLKNGGLGLPASAADSLQDPDAATLAALDTNYTSYDPANSKSTYHAEGNQINDNETANTADDYLNYVDLTISHAKYDGNAEGGYDRHAPIDLPGWYCMMSGPGYPNARAAIGFAFAQEGANIVGPLGERAGLDIKENYLNILRLKLFPDASAWVNTSGDVDVIDWQAIDPKRTAYEVYLVERPFSNEKHLFYVVVFDDLDKQGRNFSYIRPDGTYYEHLMARKANGEKLPWFNTRLSTSHPEFALQQTANGSSFDRPKGKGQATPLNLFGAQHPGGKDSEGKDYTNPNGACPAMGGDNGAGYYGAAWPNNYQEITPLCDAVMLDVKAYANLDGADWNNEGKYLPNATINGAENSGDHDGDGNPLTRGYVDKPGEYGAYTDPYLNGVNNPEQFRATGTQNKTYQSSQDAVSAKEPLPFTPGL